MVFQRKENPILAAPSAHSLEKGAFGYRIFLFYYHQYGSQFLHNFFKNQRRDINRSKYTKVTHFTLIYHRHTDSSDEYFYSI